MLSQNFILCKTKGNQINEKKATAFKNLFPIPDYNHFSLYFYLQKQISSLITK